MKRIPSTRELFKRLKKDPSLYPLFYRQITKKIQMLPPNSQIYLPKPSDVNLESLETILKCLPLEDFFVRSHSLKLNSLPSQDIIWDPIFKTFTDSIRYKNKILLYNPQIDKDQAWGGICFSDTKKHLFGSGAISYFGKNINREYIELKIFNGGYGYFDPRQTNFSRIYLLAAFDGLIGFSEGNETNIGFLQVDRFKFEGSYISELHGYPVQESYFSMKNVPKPVREAVLAPENIVRL